MEKIGVYLQILLDVIIERCYIRYIRDAESIEENNMSKILEKATKAKAKGFVYMASVVKSVFTTTYYNVVKIDDVIAAGKWIPAEKGNIGTAGAYGRIGVSGKNIDWSKTCRK